MSMNETTLDAVVIGAGFAGMYTLKRIRDDLGMSVLAVEKGEEVGGTWYWNRYPGARCDAPSIYYSYSFDAELDKEWTWRETYAAQPDILAYAKHVADRFELRPHIRFGTEIVGARWREESNDWKISLDTGEEVVARYLVSGAGCLSVSQTPDFPGIETFQGTTYHTGAWPEEGVDLTGQRVVVIGTGSSGVQILPEIAKQAAHVTVLQRTPNFTIPARNRAYTDNEIDEIKANYSNLRAQAYESFGGSVGTPPPGKAFDLTPEQREESLQERWDEGGGNFMFAFEDSLSDLAANEVAVEFVRTRIREIVEDPKTAEQLVSMTFPIGAKRLCIGTDFYETFNRPNVTLIGLRTKPLETITETGVRVGGEEVEADIIVFATGFDAITGPLSKIDIRGVGGQSLAERWATFPGAYLGIAVAGFPNLFTITGPGSPSVLSNVIASIEQHVDWMVDYLAALEEQGVSSTQADPDAEREWMAHVTEVANQTLFPMAPSWYHGSNIPGKQNVFLPYVAGIPPFREICEDVAKNGYRGFVHN